MLPEHRGLSTTNCLTLALQEPRAEVKNGLYQPFFYKVNLCVSADWPKSWWDISSLPNKWKL